MVVGSLCWLALAVGGWLYLNRLRTARNTKKRWYGSLHFSKPLPRGCRAPCHYHYCAGISALPGLSVHDAACQMSGLHLAGATGERGWS